MKKKKNKIPAGEIPDLIAGFFIPDERRITAPSGYVYLGVMPEKTFKMSVWEDKKGEKIEGEKGRSGESLFNVFVGVKEVLRFIIQDYSAETEEEGRELLAVVREFSTQIGFDFDGVEAKAIKKQGRPKGHKKDHKKEKHQGSSNEKIKKTRPVPIEVTDALLPIIRPSSNTTVSPQEVIRELILDVPTSLSVRSLDGKEIRIGPGEIPVCEICSPHDWEKGVLWWIIKGQPKIYGKPTSTWEMLECREIQP